MFFRFGVQNHRSFRDPVELSFVSTSQQDPPTTRFPAPGVPHGVLPVLGVFGANASGKSGLLDAFGRLSDSVAHSFAHLRPDEPMPWLPWRLLDGPDAPPTTLDVDFVLDGIRHHYGFSHRSSGIDAEWLYAWPSGRRRLVFERSGTDWDFGTELAGRKTQIRDATRDNALFLSTAAQLNHPRLGPVAAKLANVRVSGNVHPVGPPILGPDSPLLRPDRKELVQRLLQAADLGVWDFRVRELEPGARVPDEIRSRFSPEVLAELERTHREPNVELVLSHGASEAEAWTLEPELESSGTNALVARLHEILSTLDSGGLLVADELHTSLHPDLCAELVSLFVDAASNPHGAQLLFTSHDRTLLRSLRRDEVVLVEKTPQGVSSLRTASDFRGLRGRDDLVRAHEEGRIGGVPAVGDLSRVVERFASRE